VDPPLFPPPPPRNIPIATEWPTDRRDEILLCRIYLTTRCKVLPYLHTLRYYIHDHVLGITHEIKLSRLLPYRNKVMFFARVRSRSHLQSKCWHQVPCCRRQFSKRHRGQKRTASVPEKIMFQSLGCPRNFVDTEVMLGLAVQNGLELTQDTEEADYLVVNTCGFLQSARDESSAAILQLINEKRPGSKLLVTGCMVNLHKDQILENYPEVDKVLGSGSVDKVIDAIRELNHKNNGADEKLSSYASEKNKEERKSFLEQGDTPRFLATPPHYAYLKIAEGCRKRCSFCIIPKIKGRLQSKPVDQVVEEFQALLEAGASEVILIAQDLGDYGKDMGMRKTGLSTLLKALLDSHPGDFWLRLLYLYPDEITPEVIDIMQSDKRLLRYLDMPLQHINDRMLKAMKRTTSSGEIKSTIRQLRDKLPEIQIRTSLMVGFPGETETEFQELLDFVREFRLDNVGVFKYSNEEMAWSSKLDNHVSEEIKDVRYNKLMEVQLEVIQEKNRSLVDQHKRFEVVVEGLHHEYDNVIVGRHYGQCPDIDGQVLINDVDELNGQLPRPGSRYLVEVTDFDNYDLIGRIII
jgi:ribosomal protein S12 methylthiotransferase